MFHSALPPLLSVSTVCSITVSSCRYLAFPQPQAAPLCCISLSSSSGEFSAVISHHLPIFLHSNSVPMDKPSSATLALSISWADQVSYYIPFSSCSSSPAVSSLSFCPSLTFCCALCFKQSFSLSSKWLSSWSWSEELLLPTAALPHLCITLFIQTLDLTNWGLATFAVGT